MPVTVIAGQRVRVYRFRVYDVASDEFVTSTRLALEPAIERIGAIKAGVPIEVPWEDVDEEGFTKKNYPLVHLQT